MYTVQQRPLLYVFLYDARYTNTGDQSVLGNVKCPSKMHFGGCTAQGATYPQLKYCKPLPN